MRFVAVLFLLAATFGAVHVAAADEVTDAAYRAAIAAARASPADADYAKLRELFAASRYFGRGSGKFEQRALEAATKFEQSGKTDKAAIDRFVDDNFGDIHAHAVALNTIGTEKGSPTWRLHATMLVGLARAAVSGRSGKSREQAIRVFSISEEYALIGLEGLKREGQALLTVEGRSYDRLTVVLKDGRHEERWFDISAFLDAEPAPAGKPKAAPPK